MDNIVIVGSSGHAKVVIDIVEQDGKHRIVGLLDRFRAVGEETMGYPILGGEPDLPALIESHTIGGVIVAIGDNFIRSQVAAGIRNIAPDLPFVAAIHPRATVSSSAKIGHGTVIMAGAVVNPCCAVGRCCIINTNSSLDHDSTMDDFSSLAPRAVTGGNCKIGTCSAIGIGAVLKHGTHIGEHSIIGAGSLALKPVDSYVVTYGVPAKAIRPRRAGDKYL